MRASHYAHALEEMLASHHGGEDALLKHFVGTVEVNGHTHLLGKIVRSFDRIMRKKEKQSTIEVTSAHALSEAEVGTLLKKEPYKLALSADHKRVVRKTDSTVVGGVIVRTGSMRIDGSHKRALLDLYQNMTSNL